MADADAASAAMPWGDSISVSPLPMVRMTRQPPLQVPRLIARAQETITQLGALDPLASGSLASGSKAPSWVIVSCALAISLGTWSGGWRVIRTMGKGLTDIESPQGMAAEAASASAILLSSYFGY